MHEKRFPVELSEKENVEEKKGKIGCMYCLVGSKPRANNCSMLQNQEERGVPNPREGPKKETNLM